MPDLDTIRNRILLQLKVGKQSPEYKRSKAVLDKFIAEVEHHDETR